MKTRLLFIVHLPPPIHGASMVSELVINSSLISRNFQTKVMPLHFADSVSDIGHFSLRKLSKMIIFFFRLLLCLLRYRPKIIYYTIAPKGFAFVRDALFVTLIKYFRVPIVFHLHSQGIQISMKKGKLLKLLYLMVFNGSNVICITEHLKSEFAGLNVANLFYLPNGIPTKKYPEKTYQISPARILFVANLLKAKGILLFLEALEILASERKDFIVQIIGADGDVTVNSLRERVVEKGLHDRVSVLGAIYGEEKFKFFEEASMFVMASYSEIFPLSILEAMNAALPIIASNVGGVPDMVKHGVNGLLFAPGDRDELASQIRRLLVAPEEVGIFGDASRQLFDARFTIDQFESSLYRILEVISNNKRS